jgi:hypothetical protein
MAAMGRLVAGRYRIVRPLGAGGLGRVWLATDERRGRPVALKEYLPPGGLIGDEQELVAGWMIREARAFAQIRHRNVVRILDVLPGAGAPWIVMEFVPSRSLLEVIEGSGRLPPPRVAAIGVAVLAALEAAGQAGVLHLDVKPGNVLIADDGRILLTDFGPAVTGAGLAALAGAGIAFGSPKYLAPERLGGGGATARADLWSLGATLYHAVEGHPPYGWVTTETTLRALARTTPDPPVHAGPLAPVLSGLLCRDPAARLSAADAAEALRRVAATRVPPPRTVPQPPVRRSVPRRRLVAAGALLVVAAGLLGGARAADRRGAQAADAVAAEPVVAVSPVPQAVRLPAGFTWHDDPGGFRIAVPLGWRVSHDGAGRLVLTAPLGGQSVRVGTWASPSPNVVAALIAEERDVGLADYRRLRIEALPEPPDAVWEFTYRDPAAGPMRGLRRVLAGDEHTYLIEWRAPRASWAAGQATLAVVLGTFRPARGG